MELGLLMFMAGVGLNAGGGIVEIIERTGACTPEKRKAFRISDWRPVRMYYHWYRKVATLPPGLCPVLTS